MRGGTGMKKIDSLVLGAYGANCYLLWNDGHVLIVDPGSKSPKVRELIEVQSGIVDGIFLTHGHFDHIAGTDALVDYFHCPLYINDLDVSLLTNPYLNVSAGTGSEVIVKTKPIGLMPGHLQIGKFSFTLIDAPGHSEGSCLMIWDDKMICGDVLFQGSIGRTDLVTGSNPKMFQTLQMIKTLNPDLKVYPGHGNPTTLQDELRTNPYLD